MRKMLSVRYKVWCKFRPRLALKMILFTMEIRSIFLVLLHGSAESDGKGKTL